MRIMRGPFDVAQYRARRKELEDKLCAMPRWAQKDWVEPYYVYRYYNDNAPIGHRLHYIGMTREFDQRDSFHQWKSDWRKALPITRIEIVEYPDKRETENAERMAIRYEIPCHNGDHNALWRTTHPDFALTPACDPDFLRTGKTDAERRRGVMTAVGEIFADAFPPTS